MSTIAPSHFVFVDFENVPTVDLGAIKGQPVQVILLVGKNQKKIDLELVEQIHEFAAQVRIVKVGGSGHNALDLTLAYYLGRAVERAPAAHFAIVSKDKDFTPMIAHLQNQEIAVARYDAFTALPFLPHPKPVVFPKNSHAAKTGHAAKKTSEDRGAKVIARLKNPTNPNRPTARKTLLAHLKTSLGKEASDAKVQELFLKLCDENVLTIDDHDKVVYGSAH